MYFSLARFAGSVFVIQCTSSEQPCRKTEDLHVVCYTLNTFTVTLMFAYPFFNLFDVSVQRQYGLRIISFDEDSFNVPTTNNLNRTFLLVH